ncbi:MAG: lipid-binding SYLF domain-containing protein [Rhodospirillales bacterium]|nr:lipid-binding SYLF domain-containing protein [Rhodospirillales bacterium]
MRARWLTVVLMVLALPMMAPLAGCSLVPNLSDYDRAVQIVNASQATIETFKASQVKPMDEFRALLPHAVGMVILPGVLKGGFIVAAEGGNGVLVAKNDSGQWSAPAFYFLAAGSVGMQVGGQATDIVLLVFNQKAVQSIIDHQGKLGADLGLVIGTVGAGVEASTTANIGADVMAFAQGVGIFAGGSLEAAALVKRNDLNEAFYNQALTPSDIVLNGQAENPAADGLRSALAAYP